MRLKFLVVFAAALLMAGSLAFGQNITANLTGTVTVDNSPIPGATVTISSPAMQGTRTTVSDVNGNYNFAAVPPGTYKVKFDMEGMQSVTKTVQAGVGQIGRADAALRLTAMAESITVTAAPSAVASLETTEVQSNMQQQTINKLPTARTVTGVALLMPGTTATGPRAALVISGATADQNLIMVDGANIQENLRGQTHALFIEDAIQETTVLTGAISAEYGRFTGGVVNSITKSGGNEFHGSYRDGLANPAWQLPTDFPGDVRQDKAWNQTHEATLGGRIIRDRLWFFGAGRKAKTSAQGSFSLAGNGVNLFPSITDEKRIEGKLTGQITQKHSLVIGYNKTPLKATNNNQLGVVEQAGLDPTIQQGNDFLTGHYSGVLTNNWLVEGLYSRKTFTFIGFGGDNRDPILGSPLLVITPAGQLVGDANAPYFCGVCDQETRNNHSIAAKTTYFLSTKGLGTHNVVAGYEDWAESRFSNNFQSPTNFVLNTYSNGFSRRSDGTALFSLVPDVDYIAHYPILTPSLGSDLKTKSAYVNDKWDINSHWNLNIGARFDKNEAVNSLHLPISRDSGVSPRIGANYDVLGNGKYRLTAGYNVYAGRLAEGVTSASSAAGTPASFYYAYEGPELHGLTSHEYSTAFFNWLNSVGGIDKLTPFFTSIPGAGSKIAGNNLKSPAVNEFTVGGGMQIGTNGYFRADYISRDWKNFYVNVRNLSTGSVIINGKPNDLTLISNSDDPQRTYRGIQTQAQYRLFNAVQLGANYTYSKLRGNAVQENAGSGPIADNFSSTFYPEYNNFAQNAPVGFLPSDQTHKVRLWASYDFKPIIGTMNLGAIYRYDSGQPYSAAASISTSFVGANPGYNSPPTTTTYFFSDRGAFRTGSIVATDFSATYSFPSIRGFEFYAQGYVFNAFNSQKVVNTTSGASAVVNTTVRTSRTSGSGLKAFNPFTDKPIQCPTGDTAAQCTALGANWQLTSAFGTATARTAFQAPRSFTTAFGLRF